MIRLSLSFILSYFLCANSFAQGGLGSTISKGVKEGTVKKTEYVHQDSYKGHNHQNVTSSLLLMLTGVTATSLIAYCGWTNAFTGGTFSIPLYLAGSGVYMMGEIMGIVGYKKGIKNIQKVDPEKDKLEQVAVLEKAMKQTLTAKKYVDNKIKFNKIAEILYWSSAGAALVELALQSFGMGNYIFYMPPCKTPPAAAAASGTSGAATQAATQAGVSLGTKIMTGVGLAGTKAGEFVGKAIDKQRKKLIDRAKDKIKDKVKEKIKGDKKENKKTQDSEKEVREMLVKEHQAALSEYRQKYEDKFKKQPMIPGEWLRKNEDGKDELIQKIAEIQAETQSLSGNADTSFIRQLEQSERDIDALALHLDQQALLAGKNQSVSERKLRQVEGALRDLGVLHSVKEILIIAETVKNWVIPSAHALNQKTMDALGLFGGVAVGLSYGATLMGAVGPTLFSTPIARALTFGAFSAVATRVKKVNQDSSKSYKKQSEMIKEQIVALTQAPLSEGIENIGAELTEDEDDFTGVFDGGVCFSSPTTPTDCSCNNTNSCSKPIAVTIPDGAQVPSGIVSVSNNLAALQNAIARGRGTEASNLARSIATAKVKEPDIAAVVKKLGKDKEINVKAEQQKMESLLNKIGEKSVEKMDPAVKSDLSKMMGASEEVKTAESTPISVIPDFSNLFGEEEVATHEEDAKIDNSDVARQLEYSQNVYDGKKDTLFERIKKRYFQSLKRFE